MVVKAGLGLIGLGAISVGGVALAKPHWFGMDYMPQWHPLSEVDGYSSNYGSGKFGSKHGKYWVSNEKANEGWWEWSFRRLQEDKDKVNNGAFAFNTKVETGFKEGTNTKSLGEVCDKAYKAETGKVKSDAAADDEFNEEHVWKYCSPFGGKLKTVKEVDNKNSATPKKYDGSKMGKTKENDLISVTDSINDKFWEIREKEFKDLSKSDQDSYFVKNRQGKNIKQLCGEVYDLPTSNTDPKVEENTVVKYCALSFSTGDA